MAPILGVIWSFTMETQGRPFREESHLRMASFQVQYLFSGTGTIYPVKGRLILKVHVRKLQGLEVQVASSYR